MFRKKLPIVFIGLSIIVAALVLSWAVFIKLMPVVPVQAPVVDDEEIVSDNEIVSDDDIPEVDTSNGQIYKNEKYGYEIKFPKEWRIATEYMKTIAELGKDSEYTLSESGFVVITKLSLIEEREFIEFAKKERGIASSPYFNFGLGKTITILPIYYNKEDLYKEINDSIIIKSSNIREVALSEMNVTRFRMYEATDNGEFDYEMALFPSNSDRNLLLPYNDNNDNKQHYINIRIERNDGDFEKDVFEWMLSNFKFTNL